MTGPPFHLEVVISGGTPYVAQILSAMLLAYSSSNENHIFICWVYKTIHRFMEKPLNQTAFFRVSEATSFVWVVSEPNSFHFSLEWELSSQSE